MKEEFQDEKKKREEAIQAKEQAETEPVEVEGDESQK